MERSGCDEKDVVRADIAVLRRDGTPLDDRQHVTLHALRGGVRAMTVVRRRADLVDLVYEDDACNIATHQVSFAEF